MTNVFIPATVSTKEQVFIFTEECIEVKKLKDGTTFYFPKQEVIDSFSELRFLPSICSHTNGPSKNIKPANSTKTPEFMLQLDSTDKYTRFHKVMYLSIGDAVVIDTVNPTEPIRRLSRDAIIKTL